MLRLLGEGGMGMVFLARDRRSGAKVTIKVLKSTVASNARAAAFFCKEVQHLAKLAHPHIVRVLDAAPDEQGGWFVMPCLERGSLDRLIREQGPLPADRAGLLFTSWSTEDQVGTTAYRHNLAQKSFFTEGGPSSTNDVYLNKPSFLRAIRFLPTGFTSSGSPKLLAFLYTNYGLRPRGLCCFDYASGALEWTRLTGPPLINLEILDLNGDGTNEVLCSGASPDNGNAEPDAGDDRHAYVFAFDIQGKVLWEQPLGGPYGHADLRLADLAKAAYGPVRRPTH